MKLVIFGLTVSSSWGNGHATLWRGLCASLGRRGHKVVFFERDVPYYASTRDLTELPGGGDLIIYSDWRQVLPLARPHLADCDVAMVTSYCFDGIAASDLVRESGNGLRVFYDLDTPVTLARLRAGEHVAYVSSAGYRGFDLVLSYTGGVALRELQDVLGASRVATLYGSVDPAVHRPSSPVSTYKSDLSYLGTYSADRDDALQKLFLEPAKCLPERRFLIGGSMYDSSFPRLPNVFFLDHLAPAQHSAFYCSAALTLNITRGSMAQMGFCPSGRLFEAAACGAPILTDYWEGLETFFEPDSEILIGRSTRDAICALNRSPEELARIGRGARERTLACHTSDHRARELENILEGARFLPAADEVSTCGA